MRSRNSLEKFSPVVLVGLGPTGIVGLIMAPVVCITA